MADPRCGPGGCAPVVRPPLTARDAAAIAARLKVLAHPARLRLLSLVAAHPRGEACVCDLVAPLGRSQPTVTHHLQALHRAGFLAREKRGVWVWYRVVPSALGGVARSVAGSVAGSGAPSGGTSDRTSSRTSGCATDRTPARGDTTRPRPRPRAP